MDYGFTRLEFSSYFKPNGTEGIETIKANIKNCFNKLTTEYTTNYTDTTIYKVPIYKII